MTTGTTELEGKTAVITGGVKGLGLAISRLLAERGATVALIDIDEAGLETAVSSLGGRGRAHGVAGDIRRRADAHRAFGEAAERLGGVDILVNNAGVYPRKPILEIDDETWDYVFDVNLRAMFHMTVAAARHMQPRRAGRIVSIASIDAYIPYAKNAHYAAAKAGVISFTKSFAQELAPEGILVNAVSPGPIDTPNLRQLGIYEDLARSTPLGRVAAPEDIAEVVGFLAGPRNRYMTGETVIASGGILMA
ncbi:SDR family NAD(P)-dependent oxidoreductase [Labrys wisconsinensis]|uniref:NAD(P)-dependent dehydrogenase (Short-subunit alcohol dehydrogenase family) n=1 Tax=Labrys wisconsinensis TaxID=425677 RepID=A0ABU0J296_9HYPH|nr:SDR family NAD(P)-dependent oxidoreductase [Labrys wisconsinensis]MDQ0468369.1 NAD(P)-dependent dehydrogenase (short-subunit alcohol dehydrogenase family) [Labrys wisconsinensis]